MTENKKSLMYEVEDDIYPSEYYQTPTTLTARDYVAMLETVKLHGDFPEWADKINTLFQNLKEGHKHAYDLMNELPTFNGGWNYRVWLAWRVLYLAIQYFSRFWRADRYMLEHFEEYQTYLKYEGKCMEEGLLRTIVKYPCVCKNKDRKLKDMREGRGKNDRV